MSDKIDISGLDKAEVLVALYNRAKPLGMGMLHYDPTPMNIGEAQSIIMNGSSIDYPTKKPQKTYFDYLKGRVMKVNIADDLLDVWAYDRDNGQGAAYAALKPLLENRKSSNA